MNQTFMKEKPIIPLILSMALPMTISMLVNALYNIVDSYFVAKISENAMTALSLVFPIQNLVASVTIGFAIGINALIAYFLGAGDSKEADRTASVGVFLNTIHGIVLMFGCILLCPMFLKMFTKDADILILGTTYSNIVFLFAIPQSAAMSFEKIFQSVGRMKASMMCMLIGCITNIILDPLLIFGIRIFPKMGIRGAALATGIGQLATLSGYIFLYFVKPLTVKIHMNKMLPDRQLSAKLYSIGVPAALNMALPSLQISVLNAILAAYSSGYVLVLGAYFKLQTFLYLTANGVVQGMRPVIGYNYGAGESKRVKQIFKVSTCTIAIVMVAGTILCLALPGSLIGLFTSNAVTISIGKTALRIISLGFIVSSISVTASGALEGLGKGKESLIITGLRYIIIMLPLAYILSHMFGADGVWHAFWVTELLTAAIALICTKKSIY